MIKIITNIILKQMKAQLLEQNIEKKFLKKPLILLDREFYWDQQLHVWPVAYESQ